MRKSFAVSIVVGPSTGSAERAFSPVVFTHPRIRARGYILDGVNSKTPRKVDVRCPCCDATLTVDAGSGEVLFTKRPDARGVSFEDALSRVREDEASRGDRFDQAIQKEKGRKDLIDAKFREAMERVDELDDPTRDIDLD